MWYSTDPHDRAEFAAALRELADFLDGCATAPVPCYGDQITLHADSFEDGGKAQVDHIARILHAPITDETKNGGHYTATRYFGCIGYEVVSIPGSCTARYNAERSYWGCITPDAHPPVPDSEAISS